MEKVELRPAFEWICEHCGRGQFVSCVVPEFSGEELEELKQEHGIEVWEEGAFLQMPEEVTCDDCGAIFGTYHMDDDDEVSG